MPRSKRAQEGTAVTGIIIVIALFMVFYILFIPPAEREQLLNQNNTNNGNLPPTSPYAIELLAESPGLVTPLSDFATVHRIPSVNVFLRSEPKIITLAQNLQVSKSVFSGSSPLLRFQTEDLEETTKVTLFFSVDQSNGELRVKVNGDTIYSEEIKNSGIKVIEIAKSYLQNNNNLELSVSSPGIAFWQTNKYSLKDIGIKQEFERKNNEETRTFTITSTEKSRLTSVKLKYTQQCNAQIPGNIAHLEIMINEQRMHSAKISCITTEEELDVSSSLLNEGLNTITFRLEKGDFSFNLIKLETNSRESNNPTYFFSLSQEQYNAVKRNERKLNLILILDRAVKLKNARILVNTNEILMQTDKTLFESNLKDYVVEGTNFVKVIPINSFNIVGLKATLQ